NTPGGNIRTPQDALWWAFATITTVGYGDRFPVTTEGRMIAAVLMTAGGGIFGSFTGLVASWIMRPSTKDGQQDSELTKLREDVAAIQQHLGRSHNAPAGSNQPVSEDLAQLAAAWPSLHAHVKARILAEANRPIRD